MVVYRDISCAIDVDAKYHCTVSRQDKSIESREPFKLGSFTQGIMFNAADLDLVKHVQLTSLVRVVASNRYNNRTLCYTMANINKTLDQSICLV